ncbi:hypothetical protein [Deinococcus hopiensis]|uniref:hypothetical protein n=1 Tax=Deinococcus hopiensis TaxID=309885 RepID=UPI001FEA4731|nr:hypothetical protein [Deinococcus hopiensis]
MREAEGTVTAVLVRVDDDEDKLVVLHENGWTDAEIMKAVWFQERYFGTRLVR